MKIALFLGLSLCVAGCSVGSSVIRSETVSYDDVIEDTTNKLLLANVLRARDKAPLHFSEVTKISETVQQTASLSSTLGFGSMRGSARDTYTPGYTIQMSPNFELAHVYTKEFVTGIASPIDQKFVKYWLDRGLDRRIVLFLFFSSAEIVETAKDSKQKTVIKILNSPRLAIGDIAPRSPGESPCNRKTDFERYITLINHLERFFATEYTKPPQVIARNLTLDPRQMEKGLRAISAIDLAKYKLNCADDSCSSLNLELASKDSEIALCYFRGKNRTSAAVPGQSINDDVRCGGAASEKKDAKKEVKADLPEVLIDYGASKTEYCEVFNSFYKRQDAMEDPAKEPRMELRLNIRSVGEIIQFLGDLLELQDRMGADTGLNNPVTLAYCPDSKEDKACGDILFAVNSGDTDIRFTFPYRNKQYSIANFSSSYRQHMDHSIEVLSVINQLIGLNRSAGDVKSTPSVRLIP